MKSDSKYAPLFETLTQSGQDQVTLTFAEIEARLGERLPPSARARRDWWGNRKSALQASAWMNAGYHVETLDLDSERVTFRKPVRQYRVQRDGATVVWDRELVKGLRAHLGANQSQFAQELGVRQQTVSEWETGVYAPRRAMSKYLTLVAERAGFKFGESET